MSLRFEAVDNRVQIF